MLFRGYWQRLRDDSFRRFRTTLSSASTPLATRDGQVGGCTSSNTRQRARNEGGTWCNYFPSLWNRDAYVVRELRACFVPFLERILCLCLERESRQIGSCRPCNIVRFRSLFETTSYNAVRYSIPLLSPRYWLLRIELFFLYTVPL